MRVTYDGPHDAVDVPDAALTAQRGETVEVPDKIAKSLIESGMWREAKRVKGGESDAS